MYHAVDILALDFHLDIVDGVRRWKRDEGSASHDAFAEVIHENYDLPRVVFEQEFGV
jgi:hypothetical protein